MANNPTKGNKNTESQNKRRKPNFRPEKVFKGKFFFYRLFPKALATGVCKHKNFVFTIHPKQGSFEQWKKEKRFFHFLISRISKVVRMKVTNLNFKKIFQFLLSVSFFQIFISCKSSVDDSAVLFSIGSGSIGPLKLKLKNPKSSPGTNRTPTIEISGVKSRSEVRLYAADPDSRGQHCSADNVVATGVVPPGQNRIAITTPKLSFETYVFHATAKRPDERVGTACSVERVIYQVLHTAPLVPTKILLVNPRVSPSANRRPTLRVHGVISGDTISLHTERTCSAASKVGEKEVPNEQTTIDITTNPLPDKRFYTFYAKATNEVGSSNCSRASINYTLIISPSVPTRLSLQSPSFSPNVDKTPTIRVYGLIEGDTVSLHPNRDSACAGNANTAAQNELARGVVSSGQTTIDLTTSSLTSRRNTIYARAFNNRGFSCSTAKLDYIVISDPDAPLELGLTEQPNPFENIRAGNDNTPAIRVGDVVEGDTISLHTESTCSDSSKVTEDNSNVVPQGQNYIILTTKPLTTPNKRFYTFYTKASNDANPRGSCSAPKKMEYALIREPVPKINFQLENPSSSPNTDTTPTFLVKNLVERDIVSLYTDPQCSATQFSEEVTVGDLGTTATVPVTTPLTQRLNYIYVKVRNIVGEKCSGEDFGPSRTDKFTTEKVEYVVIKRPDQPPTALTVEQPESVAPDGTIIGSSTHPTIRVHGVVPGDTISVHTSDSCTTSSKKGEHTVANGRSYVDVVVSSLTESDTRFYTFYAKATNSKGSSSCSTAKLDYALIRETTSKTNFNLKADPQNTGPPYADKTPTFQVNGLVEKDMVSLYTDSSCSPSGRISDEEEVGKGGSTVEVTTKELTARFNNIYVRVRSIVEDKCSGEDFGTRITDKFSTEKVEYALLVTPDLPSEIYLVGEDVQRFEVEDTLITGWDGIPTIQVRGVIPGDTVKVYKDDDTTDQDTCTALAATEVVPAGQTYVDIELEERLERGKTYAFYAKAKNDEGETDCHFTSPIPFQYKFDPFEAPVGTVEKTGFWVKASAKLNDRFFEIPTSTSEVFWRDWPLKTSSKPPHPDCLRNCGNDKNCIRNCYNDDDCFIDTTKDNDRRKITCYVDIPEGILQTHELELQYNLPPKKCHFFRQTPSWHWNREPTSLVPINQVVDSNEPGVGPRELHLIVDERVDPATYCPSSSASTCTSPNEVISRSPKDKEFQCIYDHSSIGGPNCCYGNYTLYTHTQTGTGTQTENETRNWGGNYRGCIGGPARMNWEDFHGSGYPIPKIVPFPPENGYSASYKTPALNLPPANLHSLHAANYYSTLSHRCRGPDCKCHGCTCSTVTHRDCERDNDDPNIFSCNDNGDTSLGNYDCAFQFHNIQYACIGKDCVRSDDTSLNQNRCTGNICRCTNCQCSGGDCDELSANEYSCDDSIDGTTGNFDCTLTYLPSTSTSSHVFQCKGSDCQCVGCTACRGGDCNGKGSTNDAGNLNIRNMLASLQLNNPQPVHGCHNNADGDGIAGNFDCTYLGINHRCVGADCVRTDAPPEIFMHQDRSGDPLQQGNAPHIFQCLDNVYETKYEIKVYVREWNTLWDFEQLFVTGAARNALFSPDVGGTESEQRARPRTGTKPPSGCQTENGETFSGKCNDFIDLEDQRKKDRLLPVSYPN